MSLASLGDGVANDTDEVDRLHCRTRQLRRADEMLHPAIRQQGASLAAVGVSHLVRKRRALAGIEPRGLAEPVYQRGPRDLIVAACLAGETQAIATTKRKRSDEQTSEI